MHKIHPDAALLAFGLYKVRDKHKNLNIVVTDYDNYSLVRETNLELTPKQLIHIIVLDIVEDNLFSLPEGADIEYLVYKYETDLYSSVISDWTDASGVRWLRISKWDPKYLKLKGE